MTQNGNTSPSAFIREQLANGKSPPEIFTDAKAAGLTFSRNLIYAVKSAQKASVKKSGRRGSARDSSSAPAKAPARRATVVAGEHGGDALFRKLAVEMGLARARELLDDLEARLRQILDGR